MGLEHEVGPRRRAGVAERGRGELAEQPPGRCRVVRRGERLPVRLALHAPADEVLRRGDDELEDGDDEEREGNGGGLAHAAAPPRREHQDERAGQREEPEPGDRLRDVVARVVRELVGEDDVHLAVGEAAVQQGVPQHDPRGRAHAEGVGVRLTRVAADLLDAQGDPLDALRALEARVRPVQAGIVGRLEPRREVGADEDEDGGDQCEHARARDPPPRAEPARERHHDEERDAHRDEGPAEGEPSAEDVLEVADLRDAVTAVPPEGRDRERKLGEPHDRQPDHAEEHPRADRPGGGLAHVAHAALRVDGERRQQHDLGERPVHVQEALVPLRSVDERLAEHGVDVDPREGEIVGNDAPREEPRRRQPERADSAVDRETEGSGGGHGASPPPTASTRFTPSASAAGGSEGTPARAGDESGYRDVSRARYPSTWPW